MRIKYEPVWEPLHIYVEQLFINCHVLRPHFLALLQGLGFREKNPGFRVQGLEFRV